MAGHKDDFPRIKVTGSDHNGSTFAGQASKLWPKTLTYTLRQLAPLRFFFLLSRRKSHFLVKYFATSKDDNCQRPPQQEQQHTGT